MTAHPVIAHYGWPLRGAIPDGVGPCDVAVLAKTHADVGQHPP
ncbi:MAG TPA: hypothetical protein VN738_01795 [Acidothermaceae bacterium]|nr:hypothetical protein [Acidothermaceae bacterium]